MQKINTEIQIQRDQRLHGTAAQRTEIKSEADISKGNL